MTRKEWVKFLAVALVAGFAGAFLFSQAFPASQDALARDAHEALPLTEISSYTLLNRMKADDPGYLIVDPRNREDYELGHIQGAISMPFAEIQARYKELPADKDLIVYCWSSECMLGPTTGAKLAELGFKRVKDLRIGWCEWAERGYPIEGTRYTVADECLVPQRSVNGEAVKTIPHTPSAAPCTIGGEGC